MSDVKKKTMTDKEKAARRAEIMANLAKAKAEKEKVEAQKQMEAEIDPRKFGTHSGITCDGCNIEPIVGYRWRCRNCKNHGMLYIYIYIIFIYIHTHVLCDFLYFKYKNIFFKYTLFSLTILFIYI